MYLMIACREFYVSIIVCYVLLVCKLTFLCICSHSGCFIVLAKKMKFKMNVLRLFLLTAVIAIAASVDDMEDADMDMDDVGDMDDMDDDEFQDTDPDMMDPGMMDPDMDDGGVMDDMDMPGDMSEEEEPEVNRVRVSFVNLVKWHFCNALLLCVLIVALMKRRKGAVHSG